MKRTSFSNQMNTMVGIRSGNSQFHVNLLVGSAFQILFVAFLSFLLVTGCTKKQKTDDKDSGNTMTSGTIKIAVDQTVQNVIESEIEVFQNNYPDAKIVPIYTTEQEAIDLFKKDTVRLAICARKLTAAEYDYFHQRTFEPEVIRVAIDGVAVITNPVNRDSMISVKDLKRVLTGEVTQWNQIYPSSKLGKIQVVFDNTKSSIVRYAADSICRDKPLSKNLNALELNEEVVKYVEKVPNAMGLIGVNHISDWADSTVVDFTSKVRVMRVSYDDEANPDNSVQPYQYYLYNAGYPLRREIFILLNDPRGELPKGFSRFLSGDIGQRIIKRSGLLPSVMPVNDVKIIEQK
jgi:phosphate transport system substrate-binding protein